MLVWLGVLASCTPTPDVTMPDVTMPDEGRGGTSATVDIALARAQGRERAFEWEVFGPEAFARAAREGRLVLLHGAAEWCHWCHVMEETTYVDPRVGRLLRDRFVTIRVDVDSRPDLEERYEEWGWPATIILDPHAEELAKYRGYIPADRMVALLELLDDEAARAPGDATFPVEPSSPIAALPWVGANTAVRLDTYYDPEGGGWGFRQKAPIGLNVLWELRRHRRGDPKALGRAVSALEHHARLLDPVWGGIYQYATGGGWDEPHYEKLMSYQADNLAAFAAGYAATGDLRWRRAAEGIAAYLDRFLSDGQGAFWASQDADVGAHDPSIPFVEGDVYYRLPDAQRRARGTPRVDDHVYAEENGLAIWALCELFAATGERAIWDRAQQAAEEVWRSHVDADGGVAHDASDRGVRHLADAATLGFALARLSETAPESEAGARYRTHALTIAEWLEATLVAPSGALWAHTVDPNALGVFARRRQPHRANVTAARLYAALGRLTREARWDVAARRVLAGVARPVPLREQGRMVGGFLLALDEVGALTWPQHGQPR